MWADISATKRFRRSWHARLKRLGLPSMARLHVLGDGASWIWKAAGRSLTGCRQTLDIYHASQHIAAAGKRLYGEDVACFQRASAALVARFGEAGRATPGPFFDDDAMARGGFARAEVEEAAARRGGTNDPRRLTWAADPFSGYHPSLAVGWATERGRSAAEGRAVPVTEAEWLASEDPLRLLAYVRAGLEDRKSFLLTAACFRRHWDRLPEACREWARLAESAAQ